MPHQLTEIEKLQDAQNKKIDFLAFSGGGAKGAIYSGVVEVLEREKITENIRAVAGSSAGAITAACVATGISSKDFTEISTSTNMKGLLGKGFLVNKDGNPLYELLQRTIQKNISDFIAGNNIDELCNKRIEQITWEREGFYASEQLLLKKQAAISDRKTQILNDIADFVDDDERKEVTSKKLERLKANEIDIIEDTAILRNENNYNKECLKKLQEIVLGQSEAFKDLKKRCEQRGKIYFKDLSLMRMIDPTKFKDLIVTAVRRDNAQLMIFNSETAPDVEIALACRASASIPLVFKPVKIEVEIDGKKEVKEFVDGGYSKDNIPTNHFKEITDNKEKKGRTLALAFGSNSPDDPLHKALYSTKSKITSYSKLVTFVMDVIYKFAAGIGGVFKYSEADEALMQKIRGEALNVVSLDTKGVGTLSFDAAQTQAEYLRIQGSLQTERHLENTGLAAPDNSLEMREFFLKVIEDTGKDRKKSWTESAKEPIEEKATALLTFCEREKCSKNDIADVMEQFIALASVNRKSGKVSNDTSTMKHLVDALNHKTTPQNVVQTYKQLLGKTDDKPFLCNDFDKIIERNMGSITQRQSRAR